jgi:hypothetical protein
MATLQPNPPNPLSPLSPLNPLKPLSSAASRHSGMIHHHKSFPATIKKEASTRDPGSYKRDSNVISTPAYAGKLKYADPRELPSFPSPGLPKHGAAAGAAASLGWANQKPMQTWKPENSPSASAAALFAQDYRIAPSRESATKSDGAKAALLAAESARRRSTLKSTLDTTTDTWGNSAANLAFKSSQPTGQFGNLTPNRSNGSLRAAIDAVGRSRPRSISSPTHNDDSPRLNETARFPTALAGANRTRSSPSLTIIPFEKAGAVPYTTMPRQMFTATPPVAPEVEEQRKADILHASAVAMAKQMYSHQQKIVDAAKTASNNATESNGRQRGLSQPLESTQPKPLVNLQQAAYMMAQERLSRLHDEHQAPREYQEYYGSSSSSRRRFSLMDKLRRRSSGDGDLEDKRQSETIRKQMSIFKSRLSEVDEKKRRQDREALLATAQRNVRMQMQDIDDKVLADTGKTAPAKPDWEIKAQEIAQARHITRSDTKGKIDVGGGMLVDSSAIDAIAAKRIQPVLDNINEKAEAERARLAALKLEAEKRKQDYGVEKAKKKEAKEGIQKLHGEPSP